MPAALSQNVKLDAVVRRILSDPEFPACSEHVRSLMALASHEESSAKSLTEVVLKDVGLTLRLLKTANSAIYNRTGKTIVSVGHAVVLLGMETVMMIASGLKFIEHFGRRSPGLRELITLSLLAAGQARRLAIHIGYPNPEEAHLCGLLRNLGEVLVAYYQPHQYAEILLSGSKVLGFSYETLAAEVLRDWNLGGKVVNCILANPETIPQKVHRQDDLLRYITAFSHLAASAVHRLDAKQSRARLSDLLVKFGSSLNLDPKVVESIVAGAVEDARASFAALGISIDNLKLSRQAFEATRVLKEEAEAQTTGDTEAADNAEQLAANIEAAVDSGESFDLTGVILMALEALVTGGGFERAVFALVDTDRTRVTGKLGFGGDMAERLDRFSFPLAARGGPVATAVLQNRDVLPGEQSAGPALRPLLQPAAFGVWPIRAGAHVAGCLYADRTSDAEPIPAPAVKRADRIRRVIALAIQRARSRG